MHMVGYRVVVVLGDGVDVGTATVVVMLSSRQKRPKLPVPIEVSPTGQDSRQMP